MLAAFRVFCILPASGGSIDWAHGMITSLHIIYINYIITRSCGDPIQHGHGAERQSGLGTGSQSDYTRGEYHYKDQDTWKMTTCVQGEEVWAFHEVAARWIMEEFGGAQETTSKQP